MYSLYSLRRHWSDIVATLHCTGASTQSRNLKAVPRVFAGYLKYCVASFRFQRNTDSNSRHPVSDAAVCSRRPWFQAIFVCAVRVNRNTRTHTHTQEKTYHSPAQLRSSCRMRWKSAVVETDDVLWASVCVCVVGQCECLVKNTRGSRWI